MSKRRAAPALQSPAHAVVWKRRKIEEAKMDLYQLADHWITSIRPHLTVVDRARLRRVNRHFYNMDEKLVFRPGLLRGRLWPKYATALTVSINHIERHFGLEFLRTVGWWLPTYKRDVAGDVYLVAHKQKKDASGLWDLHQQFHKGETMWILHNLVCYDEFSKFRFILRPETNAAHRHVLAVVLASAEVDPNWIGQQIPLHLSRSYTHTPCLTNDAEDKKASA
jgi:hypothetical protein